MTKVSSDIKKLVNEFVQTSEKVKPYRDLIKENEATKRRLASIAGEMDPDGTEEVTLVGTKGRSVTFSPAKDERVIEDMDGLFKFLKKRLTNDELMGLIRFSVSDLSKVMTVDEQARFISKVKGTTRTCLGYKAEGSK